MDILPSPKLEKQPYEREALQEIISFAVALSGLALQVFSTMRDRAKPDVAQKLARALYGPDRESKLERLAADAPGGDTRLQVIGWIVTFAGLLLLFYLRYRRAQAKDQAEAQTRNPEGLRGCAHVLYATLKHRFGVQADDGSIRVTIFRVFDEPTAGDPMLEQVIDYVGPAEGTGKGRVFPVHVGIIGLAARTGKPQRANRTGEDDAAYLDELVREWGYTDQQAKAMKNDRQSFLAVPLLGVEAKVFAIVFVDTCIANAFSDEVATEVIVAARGFGEYMEERFFK